MIFGEGDHTLLNMSDFYSFFFFIMTDVTVVTTVTSVDPAMASMLASAVQEDSQH